MSRVASSDAFPLLPSITVSAGSSRPTSRRTSFDRARKVRISEDVERHGEGSGRTTPSGLHSRRSGEHGSGDRHVLFKAPEDEDEHSASAPLLSVISGGRATSSEEERELWEAEGPNSELRGTLLDGIANMANSILGAGIIGLPYAVARAGFVMGIFLLITLAAVTDWTIRLVVLNAKLSGRESYTEVMHHCFGHWGSAGVSFFQFAFAFGGMCAFSVIIGDTIPHVIAYLFPVLAEHAGLRLLVDRRVIIILCTLAVSFPLSLHRDIVKLSKSSGFALVSMCVIVTTVVLRGAAVEPELRGPSLHAVSLIRSGVFEAIGVISFAFVCHHNTIFIYKSLSTPTLDRFYAVTHVSTAMSLFCCLLMAVSGYVVFTSKTEGNILNNFSPDDLMVNIARLCFGANMSTTIPLENYVCREVIEEYFFKDRPFSQRRHVIITASVVFSTMAISLMTCDLGVVLEIAGGLSATALAFIFPASAYFVLTKGPWYSRAKLPAVICTVFGIIVLTLSCGLTLNKAFNGEGTTKQCS